VHCTCGTVTAPHDVSIHDDSMEALYCYLVGHDCLYKMPSSVMLYYTGNAGSVALSHTVCDGDNRNGV
jgi:hypothetical protein